MKKLLILCLLFVLAIPSVGFSQNPLTKEEKVQAMYDLNKKIVESQSFKFIATWVFSEDKRGEVTESTNTITINGSNIYGPLSTLETDKPTMLKGGLENYTVNFNDDTHVITVNFKIGAHIAEIEVKPTGKAFLKLENINSGQKLSYKGGLK